MKIPLHPGLFLFSALWIMSCKRPVTIIIVEVPVLRASAIYNSDSVDNFLAKYKDTNKVMADSYLKKGIESEKTNPDKSVFFIKRAITLYPCMAYYKELGTFSCNIEKYDEMHSVYNFLKNDLATDKNNNKSKSCIDGQIDPTIIYEGLIANILTDGGEFVNDLDEDLEQDAKEMGINLKDLKNKVFSDKRLKLDSSSEDYQDLMMNFLTEKEIASYLDMPSAFHYFLSKITDTSKVFAIDKNQVREFDYVDFYISLHRHDAGPNNVLISEYFNHYLPEKKKDTNWNRPYNYNHVIHINDSILAIICAIDTSMPACPIDMRSIYHRLITMTKNGRMIATEIVAVQSGEELSTLEFNYNKYIVTYYKRYWEKPYLKTDFDNYLLKVEQTDYKRFEINPNGTIKRFFERVYL